MATEANRDILAEVRPYQRGWGVGWRRAHYVLGDGAKVTTADHTYEIVPYTVAGRRGEIVGYCIQLDGERYGFTRVPGSIDKAIAAAELRMVREAARLEAK